MSQYAKHIGRDKKKSRPEWNDGECREQKTRGKQDLQGNRGDRTVSALLLQRFIALHQSWRADEIVPAQREPRGSHVQSWHKSCWQGIEVDYIVQINCCLNLPLFFLPAEGLEHERRIVLFSKLLFLCVCAGTSPRFLPSQRDHVKNFNLKRDRLRISLVEQISRCKCSKQQVKMDKYLNI